MDFNEIHKQIEASFEKGPGDLPVKYRDKVVKGILVPEDNYLISGSIAAWAWKEIAESKFPEFYVIIGGCEGDKVYLSLEDFETPLGTVSNVQLKSTNEKIQVDEEKHTEEKSIEMQLPFLQFVSKDKLDKLKILPLLVGKGCSYETLESVAKAVKSIQKEFVVVVGSDMTKHGEKFEFNQFRYGIEQEINNLDMKSLEFIQNLDVTGLLEHLGKTNLSNGKGVCLLLELIEENGRLLDYQSYGSEDISTYASLVF
jgi:hypothetical protein|tara:strand:- start:10312 stop:11079 length:768 start_codon:yes stop_codon:yes gene_type:complete